MNMITKRYLIVTFLVSWLLWGIVAAAGKFGIEFISFASPIGKIIYVLGGITPALCEIYLKKLSSSKDESKRFLKSIVNPKHSVWMYVHTIGGAMTIQFIPVLFGLTQIKQPIYMGFVLIIPMIIGGGIEEIGWRGMLQPELEKKYPHIIAAVYVGII
ncbi:MAG: CPBP family glutamic-type intramembrane protease [Clostridiales bacterium]|nr:CPBP family glutamic-type intramembrane protease [Clostridiales bacterium]